MYIKELVEKMNKYKTILSIKFIYGKIPVGSVVKLIQEYSQEKICIEYNGYKIMTTKNKLEKLL